MEALYRKYRDQGVQSFLIYSREPHPGGPYPEPASYEERRRYAHEFRETFEMERPILIDDPEAGNPIRVAYGSLANMSYVINNRGIVSFRSNWTRAVEIEELVESLLAVEGARGEGRPQAMVHSERAFYRPAEEAALGMRNLYRITERAGTLEETFGDQLEQVRKQLGIGAASE